MVLGTVSNNEEVAIIAIFHRSHAVDNVGNALRKAHVSPINKYGYIEWKAIFFSYRIALGTRLQRSFEGNLVTIGCNLDAIFIDERVVAKKICYIKRFQLILVDYILKSTNFFSNNHFISPQPSISNSKNSGKIAQDFLTENCCDFVKIR